MHFSNKRYILYGRRAEPKKGVINMSSTASDRLNSKTLDNKFYNFLAKEFQLPPRSAKEIVKEAKEIYQLENQTSKINVGQIRRVVASINAPIGKAIEDLEKVEVILTIDAGVEDILIAHELGAKSLRRVRLARIVDQALEQGGLLTFEDTAQILSVGLKTVSRDTLYWRKKGRHLPFRGSYKGTGRGQTHKSWIVELYLNYHTYEQIKHKTHHSPSSIARYLTAFGKTILLIKEGFSCSKISFIIGLSSGVVKQYIELYQHYNLPEHQSRLEELIRLAKEKDEKKRR